MPYSLLVSEVSKCVCVHDFPDFVTGSVQLGLAIWPIVRLFVSDIPTPLAKTFYYQPKRSWYSFCHSEHVWESVCLVCSSFPVVQHPLDYDVFMVQISLVVLTNVAKFHMSWILTTLKKLCAILPDSNIQRNKLCCGLFSETTFKLPNKAGGTCSAQCSIRCSYTTLHTTLHTCDIWCS